MSLVDYNPGDIIQICEEPLFKTTYRNRGGKFSAKICQNCLKSMHDGDGDDDSALCARAHVCCAGCSLMYYCSPICQETDLRNGHSLECGSAVFANNVCSHLKSLLVRTMTFLTLNPTMNSKKFELYNGKTRNFSDLMSHFEIWKKVDGPLKCICESLANEVNGEKEKNGNCTRVDVNADYFLNLAGIFLTNGFTLYNDDETKEIGSGIFIQASIFNHSCKPSATFSSTGNRLVIRAIAPIRKGEEPTISYISGNLPRKQRTSILMERYNFECLCENCIDDTLDEQVDFFKLNRLIDFISGCTEESMSEVIDECSMASSSILDRILDTHEQIVNMMRLMYHEYDSRISSQFARTRLALIVCGHKGLKGAAIDHQTPRIRNIFEEARKHLMITRGTDQFGAQNF